MIGRIREPSTFDDWLEHWQSRERAALGAIPDLADVDEWRDLRKAARLELLVEGVGPDLPRDARFVRWLLDGDAIPGVLALVSLGRALPPEKS